MTEMTKSVELRPVDAAEIIVLADNVVDLGSSIKRRDVNRGWWAREGEEGPAHMPLAEHGFAALIRLRAGAERHTLLFDAGHSGMVALHNARCMRLDWNEVEAIALSHGHDDHTGGLPRVLETLGRPSVPVVVHDDMFVARGWRDKEGRIHPSGRPLQRAELETRGARFISNRQPLPLFDGALLVMGEMPRQTDFEGPLPQAMRRQNGGWEPDPWTWDDRSLVLRVKDEGLVVVTGCAHAGIINTLLHARALAGAGRLRAVIGGFHLFGADFEGRIERVAGELTALQPDLLVPLHCTGPRGVMALSTALPEAAVSGGVLLRVRIGPWE